MNELSLTLDGHSKVLNQDSSTLDYQTFQIELPSINKRSSQRFSRNAFNNISFLTKPNLGRNDSIKVLNSETFALLTSSYDRE